VFWREEVPPETDTEEHQQLPSRVIIAVLLASPRPSLQETVLPSQAAVLSLSLSSISISILAMSSAAPALRGAIFDLDGTLLDTEGISKIVIGRIVGRFGQQFTSAHQKAILGTPAAEWTRMVLGFCDISESELPPDQFAREWEVGMHELLAECPEIPGGLELLRQLKARGIPIALATSSSTSVVATKQKHHAELFSYFSVIVCGDDAAVKHGKPSPDIFQAAARRLFKLDESEQQLPRCVVFEDSVNGVTAGNGAGMYTVAVPDVRIHTDARDRETLYAHADEVLDSITLFDLDKYDWQL